MPPSLNSPSHLQQAERFEAFLQTLQGSQYSEWALVVMFYSALHYVEAYLTKTDRTYRDHTTRRESMRRIPETAAILPAYHRLYKASREARYDGTPFRPQDVADHEAFFREVKGAMRKALGLSI
jgi:hypothetical protein